MFSISEARGFLNIDSWALASFSRQYIPTIECVTAALPVTPHWSLEYLKAIEIPTKSISRNCVQVVYFRWGSQGLVIVAACVTPYQFLHTQLDNILLIHTTS